MKNKREYTNINLIDIKSSVELIINKVRKELKENKISIEFREDEMIIHIYKSFVWFHEAISYKEIDNNNISSKLILDSAINRLKQLLKE